MEEPHHENMGPMMTMDHTNYDKNDWTAILAQHVAETLKKQGISGNVLDFGCGTGNVSVRIADNAKSVLGVDLSQGMVDAYNAKAAALKDTDMKGIQVEDIASLSTQVPTPITTAFSSLVYHHLPHPRQTTLEICKTLEVGGKFMIVDFMPMGEELAEKLGEERRKRQYGEGGGKDKHEEHSHGGNGHGHGESKEGHSHGHGHGQGTTKSEGDGHGHGHHAHPPPNPRYTHVRGYLPEQVQEWFDFTGYTKSNPGMEDETIPKMKDFFYEKAFTSALTGENGVEIDFFVAGMTRC